MSFLGELKRRNVVKVAIAYAATGWIVVEIATDLFQIYGAPPWVARVLTTLIFLGFPFALGFAWAFELTPDGLKRTSDLPDQAPAKPSSSRLDFVIIGLLVVAVGLFIFDRMVLDTERSGSRQAAESDVSPPTAGDLPVAEEPAAPPEAPPSSIAVLPFVNMSTDPDQEFFADGLTEDLLNRLAQVPNLRVPARTSSFSFKGKNPDLREVSSALGVAHVLEGSVRKSGDTLRITAQLIDADSGYHLWSESYDRPMTEIFAIQDEITAKIMLALGEHLGDVGPIATPRRPADPEIYQLVLRARYQWNQRTEEGLTKAAEFFQEAIRRDPGYAPAYAGLADSYLSQFDYGLMPWEESTIKARAAASKALELDEQLAEAHVSLAHILLHEWVWDKAEQEFQKAIELNPTYVVAHHWHALSLTALGQVEQAVQAMVRAQALDPLSTRINVDLGMAYLAAGRYAEAIEQENHTLELTPESTTAVWIRGLALEQMGHFDKAEADFRTVHEAWGPDPSILGSLGHLLAVAGKTEEAREVLAELVAQEGEADIAFFAALIHAGLNEPEEAIRWLDRAIEARSGSVRYLKVEPRLASLRAKPGYRALMERVGLPAE